MEVSGLVIYQLAKPRTWLQGNQTVSACSRISSGFQNNLTAARICQDWTFNCLYSAQRLDFIQKIAAHIQFAMLPSGLLHSWDVPTEPAFPSVQLLKNQPALYGTLRFITTAATAHYWTLS
jgi:hypothetical protein